MNFRKYKIAKQSTVMALLLLVSSPSLSAYKVINGYKVKMLSAVDTSAQILVQTDPRPDLSDLSCTSDHWLVLPKGTANYDEIYTLLLSAWAGQHTVNIGIDDAAGIDSCTLRRAVLVAD